MACLWERVGSIELLARRGVHTVESHIVRGLEGIFSPVVVNALTDLETEAITTEPASAGRQSDFLEDRIGKLNEGYNVLRDVLRTWKAS